MKLNQKALSDKKAWREKNVILPQYDREKMIQNTLDAPLWVHFGAGNIFRGFPAVLQQKLLNEGLSERGIVVCEGFDCEIIHRAYRPFDDLSLLVILKADGSIAKEVVGSVAKSLSIGSEDQEDWEALKRIFRNPSLQMASFTITEKGYSLTGPPFMKVDLEQKPEIPTGLMGKTTALCYERFLAGAFPIALVSMDNCSHNGEKLCNAVLAVAESWVKNGLADAGFVTYLQDTSKVSFPWSMIDKITPRPDEHVRDMLLKDGFEDADVIQTQRNTYVAAFVNAEEAQYLVVEDQFPNGRPPLEKSGVIFTDRSTVNMAEKMKVCTCLNPLHTAMSIFGCLLGYTHIYDEMRNPVIKRLIERIGFEEGLPVVVDPKIINPMDFIREVLEVRLPNPFMPDTPQRIICDTSQKMPIRFGETIKAYQQNPTLSLDSLKLIPLVFAGWCRYLLGIDDQGQPMDISPDPMLPELKPLLEGITLGSDDAWKEKLRPILSNAAIFGVDLYETGLAPLTEKYFAAMIAGTGAVAKTLEQAVMN